MERSGLVQLLKNSPIPLSLLHHMWQLGQYSQAGNVLLVSARLAHQTAKHRNVICHSTEHVSISPEFSGTMLYTTPFNAWHWAWWFEACMQLLVETHSIELILMPVDCNSSVMESAECWWLPCTMLTPLFDITWSSASWLSCCSSTFQ